jgi:hypothetical protein
MPQINFNPHDRTLREIDLLFEEAEQKKREGERRNYLGMSIIGDPCERKLFYGFRQFAFGYIEASGLKAIKDGHLQEAEMIKFLRRKKGIYLVVEKEGEQIGFSAVDGHFRGHIDGAIKGIVEAPNTWHIWEHKSVNEAKFNKLAKLRDELGEKKALKEWNYIYYCQAQSYMRRAGFTRHYLTVTTPGGRRDLSIRTEISEKDVNLIFEKAHRIIYARELPARISEKPELYLCKWCDYSGVCHSGAAPEKRCGSCSNFEIRPGSFYCRATDCNIENQEPCAEYCVNEIFVKNQIAKKQNCKTEIAEKQSCETEKLPWEHIE